MQAARILYSNYEYLLRFGVDVHIVFLPVKGSVMDTESLRVRIRKLRMERHLTQQDIADRIGVSLRTYSYMASGGRKLPYSRLVQIAEALGVTTNELLGGEDSVETEKLRRQLAESEARVRLLEEKLEDRDNLIAAQKSDLASKDMIIRMQERQLGETATEGSPADGK